MRLRHLGYPGQPQNELPLVSPRLLVRNTMVVPHLGQAGAPFQCDAHLFTDSDDPLRFGIGIAVELSVVRAQNQDAHLVVIYLAEFVEVQAGDNAYLLIEVALGMEVLAKAGADIGELLEPADLFRLQLTFAVDDPHIDLEPVLVGQQLLDPVIELEKGANED